MHMIVKIPCC